MSIKKSLLEKEDLLEEYCNIRDALVVRNQLFIRESTEIEDGIKNGIISTSKYFEAKILLQERWQYPTYGMLCRLDLEASGAHIIVKIPTILVKGEPERFEADLSVLVKTIASVGKQTFDAFLINNAKEIEKRIEEIGREESALELLEKIGREYIIGRIGGYHSLKGLRKPKHYLEAISVWDMKQDGYSWGEIQLKLKAKNIDDGRNKYDQAEKYIKIGLKGWPPFPQDET